MKRTIIPLIIILSLALALLSGCGCGASADKAREYYDGFKGYVDDARKVVDDFGDSAGKAVGDFFGGKSESPKPETTAKTTLYTFRTQEQYDQHYQKHGAEFGNISQEQYLAMANALINDPDALTKSDDGDTLFYDKYENEFAVLSGDGYIRTFFKPDDGIDYWNRQ